MTRTSPPHLSPSSVSDLSPLEAMTYMCCVVFGEIGWFRSLLHQFSEMQQTVFGRQLKHAVRLRNPLVIRTHEAEDDA